MTTNIKKIPVHELKLGMYLTGFEGGWFASPFWSSRFKLVNADDLRLALSSGLKECWIDTNLGLDIETPTAVVQYEIAVVQAAVQNRNRSALTLDEELINAAGLCKTARQLIISMFSDARLGKVMDTSICTGLVDDIVCSVERHPGALISLSRLKAGDDYTYMHSVAVCALMVALAKAMKLPINDVREAGLSGLLHDIGKAKIPLEILNKPSTLSEEEFATIKRHPEHGFDALLNGGVSDRVRQVCLHHHERMDGCGYPHKQAGKAILLMARMAAVCDVYDAVTSNRPYKRGWDPADALAKMISWKGHFDPKVLSAFIEVVGIYPIGSLVRLKSEKLAVVVEQNRNSYTRPWVKIFYCAASACVLPAELVDLANTNDDYVVGSEDRERFPSEVIEKLWAGNLAVKST
ncbi:putative nucleotidyltransferase with HDIG domain [Janthinobacterium sp. CG_23.3]|uniref:HD-GYP domain-containing protein n=1 Tax=Janthinobacterium sp. CG_23.3 TaxID=3349634 RepID=UPI0038D4BC9A